MNEIENGKEIVLSSFDFKETPRLPSTIFGGGVWTYNHYGEEPTIHYF